MNYRRGHWHSFLRGLRPNLANSGAAAYKVRATQCCRIYITVIQYTSRSVYIKINHVVRGYTAKKYQTRANNHPKGQTNNTCYTVIIDLAHAEPGSGPDGVIDPSTTGAGVQPHTPTHTHTHTQCATPSQDIHTY